MLAGRLNGCCERAEQTAVLSLEAHPLITVGGSETAERVFMIGADLKLIHCVKHDGRMSHEPKLN